jgi:hypothetical protein
MHYFPAHLYQVHHNTNLEKTYDQAPDVIMHEEKTLYERHQEPTVVEKEVLRTIVEVE